MLNLTATPIALLLSGLLGSFGHCLGMCGPLNLIVTARIRENDLPLGLSMVIYHAARIVVYILLGTLVGALGSLLGLSTHLTGIGGVTSLALGLTILLLGLGYLGWLPSLAWEGAGGWWNKALSSALQRRGGYGVALLGAVNGLLPCGLVYSALLLAASDGHAWSGALGMAAFGLGTFPALLGLDLGAGALEIRFRQSMVRLAGALMLLVGSQLLLRGGAALGIWNHFHWGSIALW